MTGEFPAQRASNAENVCIWWRRRQKNCDFISISFRVWAQPMRADGIMYRRLSLAEPLHRMIPMHHITNVTAVLEISFANTQCSNYFLTHYPFTKWPPFHWRHLQMNTQFCISIQISLKLYGDAIMGAMASRITGVSIVYSTFCSHADQRKRQNSASLAFVRRIHRWPLNSPHKGPAPRKIFPFDYVIMRLFPRIQLTTSHHWFR